MTSGDDENDIELAVLKNPYGYMDPEVTFLALLEVTIAKHSS